MENPTGLFSGAVELIGGVAGLLTTIAFVPQVIKVVRTKSTKDLSKGMCLTFSIGLFMWLIYGICVGSIPIVLANGVTLLLSSTILWYKQKYAPEIRLKKQ
jgi:MtN3 and saliva related transmembrane protein